jgi:hypothetical protein
MAGVTRALRRWKKTRWNTVEFAQHFCGWGSLADRILKGGEGICFDAFRWA